MDEKIGLTLLQEIIKRELKNGKFPWTQFMSIDYVFISKHFGPLAATWAQEQRDRDMTALIISSQKNPYIKPAILATQKIVDAEKIIK